MSLDSTTPNQPSPERIRPVKGLEVERVPQQIFAGMPCKDLLASPLQILAFALVPLVLKVLGVEDQSGSDNVVIRAELRL